MNTRATLNDIADEFRRTGQVVRWPIPRELQSSAEVEYRNNFAEALAKRSVPEIISSYVYLSVSSMDRLLALASRHLLSEPLGGVGIELGAGCGLLSSVVAKKKAVEAVLAVEVCEQMASLVIPKVASWVLGKDANKVIPIVGSFDDLRLPANSVDFAVEIDSFHHSENLISTVSECTRVLKPGGLLLCFDRSQPNTVTDDDVEQMLSQVYSREFLVANSYPPDIVLTRRENGEHEYRLFEWKSAFDASELKLVKTIKFSEEVPFRLALKGLISVSPTRIRRMLYQTDNATPKVALSWFAQYPRSYARRFARQGESGPHVLAPKETTVFLLRKP